MRHQNKSGIILVAVLWMLAILSVFAIGLGRAARVDISLAKHRAGKLRSDFLSWASAHYAMNQLRLDTEDASSAAQDTAYECGFVLKENKTPEDIFKDVTLESGSFDISYPLEGHDGQKHICYGFEDEDRYLNLNGIHRQNYRILAHLLILLDIEQDQADKIAAYIVDWKDADTEQMTLDLGAEKRDYSAHEKKICKDAPFENVEELMLVKDVTEELYRKIKNNITVFPRGDAALSVNINTALPIVLRSFFRFCAENNPSLSASDADSLTEKIVAYREGGDAVLCTADDQAIAVASGSGDLDLNANEQAVYLAATNYLKERSDYVRVHSRSIDNQFHVATDLEAVIGRENLSIMSWKRR